jgi:site-specific recombinase XerD
MSDLYIVRNHSRGCPNRHKGQKFLSCKCPLAVDGSLNGKRFRRSLHTRNLNKAFRKLADLESPEYREPKRLKDAIESFESSRHVAHGTMRNDRRVLKNLLVIATSAGCDTVDKIDVELIDLYHTRRNVSALTWTKELSILRHFLEFCRKRKWIGENPAADIRPPKVKPKPKEPFTRAEFIQILSACDKLGSSAYERLRARAAVLLLRYTALRISDVAMLGRDRLSEDRVCLYTHKNGKPVYLDIPPVLVEALRSLPTPKETCSESRHFFWSGNGTTRALVRGLTRTLARVFKISKVEGAHAHRFRHTLATGLLEKGRSIDDVAIILGSSPTIIRKHYAQWTIQRQERISSLAHDVWDDTILSGTENDLTSTEDKGFSLVDGMGFESRRQTKIQ